MTQWQMNKFNIKKFNITKKDINNCLNYLIEKRSYKMLKLLDHKYYTLS